MRGLLIGVVSLPLVASGAVILLQRRPLAARRLAATAAALTTLCAIALLFHTGDDPLITIAWLPGAGLMGLASASSGLYAVLATTVGLFLVVLSAPAPPLVAAVFLLALAGANVALLADHFLLRYVALETVALCVLLAPMVESNAPATNRSARGGYLLLRLGDAGLLVAILILWHAGGTLNIDAALEAGKGLPVTQMGWAVVGLILAVWVKLGGWPFHRWGRTGQRLSLASQAWLYATVVPNLGLYLLYRVTPLLSHAGPLQTAVMWTGATGALVAALLTLAQPKPRSAMVTAGAAQGGLALVVAAAGVKPAVWLGLLAQTPLRLLLFLAAEAAQRAASAVTRRIATGTLVFGGLVLLGFNLVTMWWARENVLTIALFIAQVAAALAGLWVVVAVSQPRAPLGNRGYGFRWAAMALLSTTILTGGLAFGPLVRFAADVTHTLPPDTPTLQTPVTSLPALLAATVLAIVVWQLRRQAVWPTIAEVADREAWDSEKGLARVARAIHAFFEIAILERAVSWVKQAATGGARVVWFVEHKVLGGILNRSTQAATGGARLVWFIEHRVLGGILNRSTQAATGGARVVWFVEHGVLDGTLNRFAQVVARGANVTYQVIEQEGLEGILRRVVRAALALGRGVQRFHTGKLRRNLLWVPAALALAILVMMMYGD